MHLGAVLVLIGTILVGLSLLLDYGPRRTSVPPFTVLAVGCLLIGIGVLVGNTVLST